MTTRPGWYEWRPRWAPHVRGEYQPRTWDAAEGRYEPQGVTATCETCGDVYGPTTCDSGRVRAKIDAFALQHLHRDAAPS